MGGAAAQASETRVVLPAISGHEWLVATTVVIGIGAFYSYTLSKRAVMPATVHQADEEVAGNSPVEFGSRSDFDHKSEEGEIYER